MEKKKQNHHLCPGTLLFFKHTHTCIHTQISFPSHLENPAKSMPADSWSINDFFCGTQPENQTEDNYILPPKGFF